MNGERRVSGFATGDQWTRCAHVGTSLDAGGGVQLSWEDVSAPTSGGAAAAHPAGLAFDSCGRGYRSFPGRGRVEPVGGAPAPPADPGRGPWRLPLGLGIDADDQLIVAEAGRRTVAIVDLCSNQPVARVPVASPGAPGRRPLDVAVHGHTAWVLLDRPAAVVRFKGRRGPLGGPALQAPRWPCSLRPSRLVAGADRRLLVLWRAREGTEAVVAGTDGRVHLEVDGASDLEHDSDGTLVVARRPGQAFRRFRAEGSGWFELEPRAAPGYDGDGIALAGGLGIVYTKSAGLGRLESRGNGAAGSPVRYRRRGRVVTYRLDSGAYRTRWGRMFVDACVPPGTGLAARFVSSDDDEVDDPLPWSPPVGRPVVVRRPDLTPPLPSTLAVEVAPAEPLHRRATGREWPWAQVPADDRFETYEAPVRARPGRYLWIVLDLTGAVSRTPRVREVRVEHPGHGLLFHLPRSWSRDDDEADFLQRFLAPAEGLVRELDQRAATRDELLDPSATPQEALAWLGSFVGLTLDRRWPVAARRTLVGEASTLLRRRGTVGMLTRLLGIYLGYPPVIVEQWRLRGLGGLLLGGRQEHAPALPRGGQPANVLGARAVGGALGEADVGAVGLGSSGGANGAAAAEGDAHRFTVFIPGVLTSEQLDVVTRLVDVHRPAHTDFDVCVLVPGMRVGRRLHVELTSMVGPEPACDLPSGDATSAGPGAAAVSQP